ncbi:MAG: hypothetical protein DI537_40065 [Stutzerimonas stutzeri]|nr:MAG: hypothetical protein DI537_40065 [Stutzerimonas stutzeri]
MTTLSHTISVDAIADELDLMETAALVDGCLLEFISDQDAARSIADKLIRKAEAYGIAARISGVVEGDAEDDWEVGDPRSIEIVFGFPDDANAVWFRTMVL